MNPVPIERKKALGNPGKRALPEPVQGAVVAVEGVPAYPESLRRYGKAKWRTVWTHAAAWLNPETDFGIVLRYCEAWDTRATLTKVLDEEGITTEGSSGQVVEHPAFKMRRELDRDLQRMEAALGFTPADRARIGLAVITVAEKRSKLDEFMESFG